MGEVKKGLWEQLTFSGLQRYVMISECVYNSDEHLSSGDRAELVQDLVASNERLSPQEIAAACARKGEEGLEANMVRASIAREAARGY